MKSPAVGWELLGKSEESTTIRGNIIMIQTSVSLLFFRIKRRKSARQELL